MTLSICTNCNGSGKVSDELFLDDYPVGMKLTIPCVHCNARGVVSDQLFDKDLIEFDKNRHHP